MTPGDWIHLVTLLGVVVGNYIVVDRRLTRTETKVELLLDGRVQVAGSRPRAVRA